MSTPTVSGDTTKHTRMIYVTDAPDVFTKYGRGGGYFSPNYLRVAWEGDGPRHVWIDGWKRKKNGELGAQDTGEYFYVDGPEHPNSRTELAPDWALEIIGGKA